MDPALVGADRERFGLELAPARGPRFRSSPNRANRSRPCPTGPSSSFTGKARIPHNYANPGSFDYVHYLARQSIFLEPISAAVSTVHIVPGHCGNRFTAFIMGVRSASLERLDKLYHDDIYTNGMMQAILIGATVNWTKCGRRIIARPAHSMRW